MRQFCLVQVNLRQARLIINRHGGAIIDCLLDIIHRDILTKDRLGIPVILRDRRSRKRKERRIGQPVTQGLGKPVFYRSRFAIEFSLESILAAVRLICNDNDVVPVSECGESLFVLIQSELSGCGKYDPTGMGGSTGVRILLLSLPALRLTQKISRIRKHI